MAKVKAPDIPRPEEKNPAPITEERLQEILSVLFPYGYSHYDGTKYTGVSPYIGKSQNIITVIANDPIWSVLAIVMERFSEEDEEKNSLGFYKGIMKMIAPELHSTDESFEGCMNVLEFYWADSEVQNNSFPAEVKYKPF